MNNARIMIQTESNQFSLDAAMRTEDAAKVMQYALQLINYRDAQKQPKAPASVEDEIQREMQNIRGGGNAKKR